MKRILLGTMAALGNITGLSALESRLLGHHSYRNTDPRAARHWHNPADPAQAARIEAAAAKRERKARKLSHNTWMSRDENLAHDSHRRCRALDPFHVAH